jgi:putative endonuclease
VLLGKLPPTAGRDAIFLRSDFAQKDLMFPAFGPTIIAGGSPMERMVQMRAGIFDRVLSGLDWVAERRGRTAATPAHLLTGIEGEDAACSHLLRNGYVVVARRWSGGNLRGDLDLIAWRESLLCFIEVKTRTAHDMSPAEAAIDTQKRKTLRRLARQYMRQLPGETIPQSRFDVISVYLLPGEAPEFFHFENAFEWGERRPEAR